MKSDYLSELLNDQPTEEEMHDFCDVDLSEYTVSVEEFRDYCDVDMSEFVYSE